MNLDNQRYKFLRKRQSEIKELWSLDNLRDGLAYFHEVSGRYPTVKEIDQFEYLPTSRTIQRSFGGMMQVRKLLNLDCPLHFGSGERRSQLARNADERAKKYEEVFYKYLISMFPEVRVHEHKIIRPGNTAADFFIYTTNTKGIVLDLFFAADLHSLSGVIVIKNKKYSAVKFPVYFVLVGNETITQEIIDQKILNKKVPLSPHIKVLTEKKMKQYLESLA